MGKFDLKTHIRDRKTGEVVKRNPYKMIVSPGGVRLLRDGVENYPDGAQVNPNQKPTVKKTVSEKSEELAKIEAELNQKAERLQDYKKSIVEDAKQEISAEKDELLELRREIKTEMDKLNEAKAELDKDKTPDQPANGSGKAK